VAKGHGEVSEGSDHANGTSNKAVDAVTAPKILVVKIAVTAEVLESPPEEKKGREGKETEPGPERPALVEDEVPGVTGALRAAAARAVLLVVVFSGGVGGLVGSGFTVAGVTSVTGITRVISKTAVARLLVIGVVGMVDFVAAFVAAVARPGQAGTSLAVHARSLSRAGGIADLGVEGVTSRLIGFSSSVLLGLRLIASVASVAGGVGSVGGRVVLSLGGSAKGEHAEEEGKLHSW